MTKERLAEENIRLAYHFAHKFKNVEDAVGVALYGLVKAAKKFNPEFGIRFSAFASSVILRELLQEYNRQKRRKSVLRPISLEAFTNEAGELYVQDIVDIEASVINGVILQDILSRISKRDADIVYKYRCEGFSAKEVGAEYGISHQRVRQIYKDIKDRAQRIYGEG